MGGSGSEDTSIARDASSCKVKNNFKNYTDIHSKFFKRTQLHRHLIFSHQPYIIFHPFTFRLSSRRMSQLKRFYKVLPLRVCICEYLHKNVCTRLLPCTEC